MYIPDYIEYALPATEKQFIEMLPVGTCVKVKDNLVFGINWHDVRSYRVDLDLSMTSKQKYGWDSYYRSESRDIMFSGDVTSASGVNGATELFYIEKQPKEAFVAQVNYFNYNEEKPVDYKIVVASEKPVNFKHNYVVDPKNVKLVVKSTISTKQKIVGMVVPTTTENRVYFIDTSFGNMISSNSGDKVQKARNFLFKKFEHPISLNDVLSMAGAKIVNEIPEKGEFIDLSPEKLEKDTILKLLVE